MADHLQGGDALLRVGHHVGRSARHRSCLRRDNGSAHGDGQRRRDTAGHYRPAAHHPRHDCRRAGRGTSWRSALSIALPAGRGTLLHHAHHQHQRGIHLSQEQEMTS